jgi:hypothetical protein
MVGTRVTNSTRSPRIRNMDDLRGGL